MNQRETVISLLYKARQLFVKKNKDYASDENAFSNFEFTGMVLDWAIKYGVCGADLAFIALLSTKMARMIELRGSDKIPQNESIEDTCVDQAVYSALWGGWILTGDNLSKIVLQTDAEACELCRFFVKNKGTCSPYRKTGVCKDFERLQSLEETEEQKRQRHSDRIYTEEEVAEMCEEMEETAKAMGWDSDPEDAVRRDRLDEDKYD